MGILFHWICFPWILLEWPSFCKKVLPDTTGKGGEKKFRIHTRLCFTFKTVACIVRWRIFLFMMILRLFERTPFWHGLWMQSNMDGYWNGHTGACSSVDLWLLWTVHEVTCLSYTGSVAIRWCASLQGISDHMPTASACDPIHRDITYASTVT